MTFNTHINKLALRLQQPLPGRQAWELMAPRILPESFEIPANARPSAVLCLLFPLNNKPHVLLMKRIVDNTAHSGQISFPGGSHDPGDADLKATALRETQEEVGIISSIVNIIGALTPLYIPVSNFSVHPFIAFANEKPSYNINRSEVANILELPLETLFHPATKSKVEIIPPTRPDLKRIVNAYKLDDGNIIWGATAMILSELELII